MRNICDGTEQKRMVSPTLCISLQRPRTYLEKETLSDARSSGQRRADIQTPGQDGQDLGKERRRSESRRRTEISVWLSSQVLNQLFLRGSERR